MITFERGPPNEKYVEIDVSYFKRKSWIRSPNFVFCYVLTHGGRHVAKMHNVYHCRRRLQYSYVVDRVIYLIADSFENGLSPI